MKGKSPLLSTAYPDRDDTALPNSHKRSLSLSNSSMTDLKSQHEIGGELFSSNNSDHTSTSVQSLSPRTMYAAPRTTSARTTSSVPSSVVDDSANQFSPDQWVISPEERALMTNSAHFARDRRRRRGAVQFEAPVESPIPSPSSPTSYPAPCSPASALGPSYSTVPDVSYNHGYSDAASSALSEADRAPPRGRLQRSFTPSEREHAGPTILPGLLRRLGRPFSGPWRGPSSPLASIPATNPPPKGSFSRLRRVFSRRRKG